MSLSGLAKKSTAFATSSGETFASFASDRARRASSSASAPGNERIEPVSTTPARTQFTLTPRGPSSSAKCRVIDSSAALHAPIAPYIGSARSAPQLDSVITRERPVFRSSIGAARCTSSIKARTLRCTA